MLPHSSLFERTGRLTLLTGRVGGQEQGIVPNGALEAIMSDSTPSAFHPRTITLPNGMQIQCLRREDALFVYKELFEEHVYLRHETTLPAEALVVDVGSNIGLFSLMMLDRFPDCRVIAIEPAPPLCDLIRWNTRAYEGRIEVIQCGIGAEHADLSFTFYPNYSILSGFCADVEDEKNMLRSALRSQYDDQFKTTEGLEDRHLDALIDGLLSNRREYRCPVRRLSEILSERHIDNVHLLKIDAEKSEAEILSGIDSAHWPGIRRLEMEVHDSEGSRLQQILETLKCRGFDIRCDNASRLADVGLYNVYAGRDSV